MMFSQHAGHRIAQSTAAHAMRIEQRFPHMPMREKNK
jgi:hypothetical protein